jgi:hypothetical protein
VLNLVTPREELGQQVFENMALRRLFGSMTEEITGAWRKLHEEELLVLFTNKPIIIRSIKFGLMRWAGNIERTAAMRNA